MIRASKNFPKSREMRGNFFAELKRRSHPLDRSARARARGTVKE
jgi:hypothetical protein